MMSDERWEILRKIAFATKAWYWTHDECVEIAAEVDRLREENALKARLAEAERVMREALKYIKPVIDGNGPARTLILHYLKHAQPPTAEGGDHGNE